MTQRHTSEVLLFTARHCSICRLVRPTVNEVAGSFEGRVRFREVDAAVDPDLSGIYGVRGVPTLIALYDGELVRRVVGAHTERQISDVFAAALSGTKSRSSLTRTDRLVRLGIALVFVAAASASGQTILWVLAAGAAVSVFWDLVRP